MRDRTTVSRRSVLMGIGGATAAALVAPRSLLASTPPSEVRRAPTAAQALWTPQHLAWVWQFGHDGDPEQIRDTLAANGLGVVVKTHDGDRWMSRYDRSATAISGPRIVESLADFFEQGGVPFHAWCVVKGRNPEKEARIASQVLDAGARSLFLDVEPHPGFWTGTRRDAWIYGEALRKAQPNARLSTSIDARPWTFNRIPLRDFADFSNELSPQMYWGSFTSKANVDEYTRIGDLTAKRKNVTPTVVVSAAMTRLWSYGLPIHPIGDGTVSSRTRWREFLRAAYTSEAQSVSVWRYGVAHERIWSLLRDTPPVLL